MDKTPYNPTVLLRCSKCGNKTSHVMISFSNDPDAALTMTYECQECGETKKVFDLNPLPQVTFESIRKITVDEEAGLVPIEKGPQIENAT